MDSSATLSFSSEPADIGNLFSSYTYDSPNLNSLDDFKGCRESEDSENYCLVTDLKEASSGTLVSVECVENNNLTNEDIQSSCLLSLCSEPPDIKNWFSSYVYESPALDSVIDFRASVYNDISDTKENGIVNTTELQEHISDSAGAARNELGLTPVVLLGHFKAAKDDKHDGFLECGQKSDVITNSVSKLEKQRINLENIPMQHFESQNETSGRNLENRFSFDETRISFETNSGHAGSESAKNLISLTENFSAQHSPDDTNKTSQTRRLVSSYQRINKHSAKLPNGDNEKDNNENGFISTRKHKQNSSQRSLRPSCFPITREADSTALKGDITGRRRVLSETTNVQRTTVSGTTGKWKCPERSKPNVGPPLKQLRLEKWVHRL